jgi:hypothetical protein
MPYQWTDEGIEPEEKIEVTAFREDTVVGKDVHKQNPKNRRGIRKLDSRSSAIDVALLVYLVFLILLGALTKSCIG